MRIPLLPLPVALLSFLVCAGCSQVPKEDATKGFQGTWKSVELTKDSKEWVLTFENDQFHLNAVKKTEGNMVSTDIGGLEKGAFQVNFTVSPSQIDLVYLEGDKQGKTRLGIFALEGEKLTLCLADFDASRPTELAAKDGVAFVVLERQK